MKDLINFLKKTTSMDRKSYNLLCGYGNHLANLVQNNKIGF